MSALPDLIASELKAHGWSMRELERATREAAEVLFERGIGPDERGVSVSTLSNMADSSRNVEPDLRTLRLLSMALKRPLRVFIDAMGYTIDQYEALSDPRKRILAMVEAAPVDTLRLIDRLIALSSEDKKAVEAFMGYVEGNGKGRE
jgi:transcriptional regulator with XRE-family HTH domain